MLIRALFFRPPFRPAERLLIIKNDAIGDYIISRNFFAELKHLPGFRTCKFYLACSPKLQPIVRQLDPDLFEEIFPIEFELGSAQAMAFYKQLRSYRFRFLLHPTFSPDPRAHSMVRFSNAPQRIGFNGDTSNCSAQDKAYYEKFYTRLISSDRSDDHEFNHQKNFFAELAGAHLPVKRPHVEVLPANHTKTGEIVLCPGAQHQVRIWAPANYARLLTALKEKWPELQILVATGPGEDSLTRNIVDLLSFPANVAERLPFGELAAGMAKAKLVICNDSAPAHLAVAAGANSVCLSNGNHYGRFVPYPRECTPRQIVVVPPRVKERLAAGENPFYHGSDVDINTIIFDEVLSACIKQINDSDIGHNR